MQTQAYLIADRVKFLSALPDEYVAECSAALELDGGQWWLWRDKLSDSADDCAYDTLCFLAGCWG